MNRPFPHLSAELSYQELAELAELDHYQLRYLRRYACALCSQTLDQPGCGSIFGPLCSLETRRQHRADCLAHYQARPQCRKRQTGSNT